MGAQILIAVLAQYLFWGAALTLCLALVEKPWRDYPPLRWIPGAFIATLAWPWIAYDMARYG